MQNRISARLEDMTTRATTLATTTRNPGDNPCLHVKIVVPLHSQFRARPRPRTRLQTLSEIFRNKSGIFQITSEIFSALTAWGSAERKIRQYAFSCTPATARPEGSFIDFHASSHSSALAVEHATLASWLTARAALSLGNHSS